MDPGKTTMPDTGTSAAASSQRDEQPAGGAKHVSSQLAATSPPQHSPTERDVHAALGRAATQPHIPPHVAAELQRLAHTLTSAMEAHDRRADRQRQRRAEEEAALRERALASARQAELTKVYAEPDPWGSPPGSPRAPGDPPQGQAAGWGVGVRRGLGLLVQSSSPEARDPADVDELLVSCHPPRSTHIATSDGTMLRACQGVLEDKMPTQGGLVVNRDVGCLHQRRGAEDERALTPTDVERSDGAPIV